MNDLLQGMTWRTGWSTAGHLPDVSQTSNGAGFLAIFMPMTGAAASDAGAIGPSFCDPATEEAAGSDPETDDTAGSDGSSATGMPIGQPAIGSGGYVEGEADAPRARSPGWIGADVAASWRGPVTDGPDVTPQTPSMPFASTLQAAAGGAAVDPDAVTLLPDVQTPKLSGTDTPEAGWPTGSAGGIAAPVGVRAAAAVAGSPVLGPPTESAATPYRTESEVTAMRADDDAPADSVLPPRPTFADAPQGGATPIRPTDDQWTAARRHAVPPPPGLPVTEVPRAVPAGENKAYPPATPGIPGPEAVQGRMSPAQRQPDDAWVSLRGAAGPALPALGVNAVPPGSYASMPAMQSPPSLRAAPPALDDMPAKARSEPVVTTAPSSSPQAASPMPKGAVDVAPSRPPFLHRMPLPWGQDAPPSFEAEGDAGALSLTGRLSTATDGAGRMDNRVPASPGLPLQGTRLPSPQLLAASQTNPLPELTPAIPVPASAPTLHPQTEATVSAAAAVARQIVHASQSETLRDTGGSVDIALDPPELGRVRLSLIEVNGTLCLSIAAERPETAELMRRHMGLLAQEFARAGLDPPSVDISQGGSDGWGEGRAPPGRTDAVRVPSPDAVAPTPAFPGPPPTKDGLDLRL